MENAENKQKSNGNQSSGLVVRREAEIGDRVRATVNHVDWHEGIYVKNIDLFAQYGIMLNETHAVVYFAYVEPLAL